MGETSRDEHRAVSDRPDRPAVDERHGGPGLTPQVPPSPSGGSPGPSSGYHYQPPQQHLPPPQHLPPQHHLLPQPPQPPQLPPHRPQPVPPQQLSPQPVHRARHRTPGWAWALIVVLVVAVAVLGAVTIDEQYGLPWGTGPSAPATPDPGPATYGQPNTSPHGTFTGEHLITELNEALSAQDRDAFFRHVAGAAVEPLQLWWDNMAVLGWSTGAISLPDPQRSEYTDDTITQQVLLGAVTGGSAQIPADSDHPDAGQAYAPANRYRATIDVTDDGASGTIIEWEPHGYTAPWDLAPLHAVSTEHTVLAGHEDEADLIERTSAAAEEAAAWVVDSYYEAAGMANSEQFLAFATEDADRFNSWFLDSDDLDGWTGDRSGTMFPMGRLPDAPGIDPGIATGDRTSNAGGIVTVGPSGLQYGIAEATSTFVHEFIHTIQQTNVPQVGGSSVVADEGWATYNESLFQGHGSYAPRLRATGRTLRGCVASVTEEFPQEQDFLDAEEATCAYALSGSLYAYAARLGVDVHALADEALATGQPVWVLVERGGVPFAANSWASWVQAEFG